MEPSFPADRAGPPLAPHLITPAADDTPFKGDEGYSEDTRSLDDGDSTMGVEPRFPPPDPMQALFEATLGLDETRRSEHAYNVLRTLRTSSIAAIVERLTPLLHLDPVAKLPPDITSTLFSYLDPVCLLQASLVSKAWRERTLDTLLWRDMFRREGWTINMEEVRRYERNHHGLRSDSKRVKLFQENAHPRLKRPAQEISVSPATGATQSNTLGGAWPLTDGTGDQVMQDAEASSGYVMVPPFDRMDTSEGLENNAHQSSTQQGNQDIAVTDSETKVARRQDPPLLTRSYSGGARVNFYHVYKQKRRLEDNWAKGCYKSFQLPHRDHPEEAHSECVYTIQYSGNFLVSGSRDKTLRIWNLDTQRLVRRPLEGHRASVLCLQFDSSSSEDIIISGSSDTDVILWQFSTGKMLKRIQNAHRESVLNLKFDKRFLVTCSKDKMIKIWNRKALLPGDPDYPQKGLPGGGRCPSYVVEWAALPSPLDLERMIEQRQIEPIPEYSLIMKIDDHGAAVNAVHIFQDQLVSASGDRALRVFDIHSGTRIATCKGHTKGIACVQYDGKRIVSGSSDNTIRIFDPKSQAQVACLQGHAKLVRTVQASFGDIPGTENELEKEARAADYAYLSAKVASGTPLNHRTPTRRERERERASRDPRRPEELTAIGAKLPPSGGGSPWARIVSGSYDETIIIWRKGTDGRWKVGHKLRQADALQAAGGPLVAQSERDPLSMGMRSPRTRPRAARPAPAPAPAPAQAVAAGHSTPSSHNGFVAYQPMFRHGDTQAGQPSTSSSAGATAGSSSQARVSSINTQMAQANLQPNSPLSGPSQGAPAAPAELPKPGDDDFIGPLEWWYSLPHPQRQQQIRLRAQIAEIAARESAEIERLFEGSLPPPYTTALAQYQQTFAQSQAEASSSNRPAGTSASSYAAAAATAAAAQAAANGTAAAAALPPAQHPNARVFKLQFDSRRIICCSQDPKIVGWDFANGDAEIEAAAVFFGNPS